jgi:hypothetical protein
VEVDCRSSEPVHGLNDESLKLAREFASQNGKRTETVLPAAVHYRGRIRPDVLKPPQIDIEEITAEEPSGSSARRRPPPRSEPIQVESRHPHPLRTHRRKSPVGGRQSVQLSLADREPSRTFHQVPLTEQEKVGAHVYREWYYLRNMYLPEWCALRTRRPKGGSADKVDQILRQHGPLVRHLKQQFEALRPERIRLNRQLDGDEIDLSFVARVSRMTFTAKYARYSAKALLTDTDKLWLSMDYSL